MKKEIRLALLGISLALGSSSAAIATSVSGGGNGVEGQPTNVAALSRTDIRQIRECVVRRDILCLRAILLRNPDLFQENTALSRALLNFAAVTDATKAREMFAKIKPVVEAADGIYS